jgi:SPP1 family predicted phage head-tail adaptor
MRIGELREKIAVLRKSRTPDGMGGWTEAETQIMSAWAKVETPASAYQQIAGQDVEMRTHIFTIRYVAGGPKAGDVVEYLGDRFTVLGVRFDERRRFAFLECRPEVG